MIKVGLQIPNFTYPDVAPGDLFERVAAVAVAAEDAGVDTVMVMDHFYQLPMLGPPEHEMLEAYTLLGALAARTSTVQLGTLVTGVTYRNPAILAKIVTTLDVISSGRAFLGIGAAWFDLEHEGLGVDFPPVKERFERLEEALHICRAMFRGERPTFEGTHYRVRTPSTARRRSPRRAADHDRRPGREEDAAADGPARRDGQLHLRLRRDPPQARGAPAALRRRRARSRHHQQDLAVLDRRRADDGGGGGACATTSSPHAAWLGHARRGHPGRWSAPGWSSATPTPWGSSIRALIGLGLDGVTFNMPANGHDLEAVTRTVGVVKAAVA